MTEKGLFRLFTNALVMVDLFWSLEDLNFEFVSYFDIRISCFLLRAPILSPSLLQED